MRAELRFTAEQYHQLVQHLLRDGKEHAALLVCGVGGTDSSLLLCRQVLPVSEAEVGRDTGRCRVDVSPITIARVAKRAGLESSTLVVCHSHPFRGPVAASRLDLSTERQLCGRVLPGRLGGRPSGALVVGPEGVDGRLWVNGEPQPMRVRVGGKLLHDPPNRRGATLAGVARQLLVWGRGGQHRLQDASVAVVGAGGIGSHVIQQLAHLGIGRLVVVDPDVVEESNLSRLVGCTREDLGKPKVECLAQVAQRICQTLDIEPVHCSVLEMDAAVLAPCDVVVCCTDGHGSRALLAEFAAQYLMPLVDTGVEVQAGVGGTRAGGGVRITRPGDPCLLCTGILDPAMVREEFLTEAERKSELMNGYLRGSTEPAPSVIALNGVVASLAVIEILDLLVGLFESSPTRLLYRTEARSMTTTTASRIPTCHVCGNDSLLGVGSSRPLPQRGPGPHARLG